MGWIRFNPLRAAAAVIAVLAVLGAGTFMLLARTETPLTTAEGSPSVTRTEENTEPVTTTTPVVETFPSFVIEFVERLNQVNAYVSIGSNKSKEQGLYRELWRWASDGGVEVKGMTGEALDRELDEPGAHTVLELTTIDGSSFCVAEMSRLDREAAEAPYLYQGLYRGDCATMLADPLIR